VPTCAVFFDSVLGGSALGSTVRARQTPRARCTSSTLLFCGVGEKFNEQQQNEQQQRDSGYRLNRNTPLMQDGGKI
jgi:hypothetical protein